MDEYQERQLRQSCLQQAQQVLAYNGVAGSVRPTGEQIRAEAQKMYDWIVQLPTPPAP